MAQQLITGGDGTTGQTGEEVKDIINENFTEVYATAYAAQTAAEVLSTVNSTVGTSTQSALDLKQDKAYLFQVAKTSDYPLVLGDAGTIIPLNSASPITAILPLNSSVPYPIGTWIDFTSLGAGAATLSATVGVTVTSQSGNYSIPVDGIAMALKTATDTWRFYNGSPALTWTTWVPTYGASQFSVNPVVSAAYIIEGKRCTIRYHCTTNGTSNGTAFTITNLPALPISAAVYIVWSVNNSVAAAARADLAAGSATMTLFSGITGGGWTAANSKGSQFCITYQIQ